MASQSLSQHSQQTETLLDVSHQDEGEPTPEKGEYRDYEAMHRTSSTDSGTSHGRPHGPEVGETQHSAVIADSLPQRMAAEAAAAALELEAQNDNERVPESSGIPVHTAGRDSRPRPASRVTGSKPAQSGPRRRDASKVNEEDDLYSLSPGAGRKTAKMQALEVVSKPKPRSSLAAPSEPEPATSLFLSQTQGTLPTSRTTRELAGVVLAKPRTASDAIGALLEDGAVAGPSAIPRHVKTVAPAATAKSRASSQAPQGTQRRQTRGDEEQPRDSVSASSISVKPARQAVQDLWGGRPTKVANLSAADALRARHGRPISSTQPHGSTVGNDKPSTRKPDKASTASSKKTKQLPTPASGPAVSRTAAAKMSTGEPKASQKKPLDTIIESGARDPVHVRPTSACGADTVSAAEDPSVMPSARKPGALKRPNKDTTESQPSKRRKDTYDVPSDESVELGDDTHTQAQSTTKQRKAAKAAAKPKGKAIATKNSPSRTTRRQRSPSRISNAMTDGSAVGMRTRQRMQESSKKQPSDPRIRLDEPRLQGKGQKLTASKERESSRKQRKVVVDKENVAPVAESYEDFEDTVVQYDNEERIIIDGRGEDVGTDRHQPQIHVKAAAGRRGEDSGSSLSDVPPTERSGVEQPRKAAATVVDLESETTGHVQRPVPAKPSGAAPRASLTITERPSVMSSEVRPTTAEAGLPKLLARPQTPAVFPSSPPRPGGGVSGLRDSAKTQIIAFDANGPRNQGAPVIKDYSVASTQVQADRPVYALKRTAAGTHVHAAQREVPAPSKANVAMANEDVFDVFDRSHAKDMQDLSAPAVSLFKETSTARTKPGTVRRKDDTAIEDGDDSAIIDDYEGTTFVESTEQDVQPTASQVAMPPPGGRPEKVKKVHRAPAVLTTMGHQEAKANNREESATLEKETQRKRKAHGTSDAPEERAVKRQRKHVTYDEPEEASLKASANVQRVGLRSGLRSSGTPSGTSSGPDAAHSGAAKPSSPGFEIVQPSEVAAKPQPAIAKEAAARRRIGSTRQASQGSQRVDNNGSPVPKGVHLDHRESAIGNYLSQRDMSSDSAVKSRLTAAKADKPLGLPIPDKSLAPPPVQPKSVLSSNTKSVPAPPHEESRAITRRVSGADAAKLVTQRERSDPFIMSNDQSSGEVTAPVTTSFRQKLREHFGDLVGSGESQPVEEEVQDEDPDKTLVAPIERFREHIPKQTTRETQLETKRTISMTSTTGTSDSDASQTSSTQAQGEDNSIAIWRNALRPHQADLFDALVVVSHKLVKHVVDQETASRDTLDDYRRQGEAIVRDLEQSHVEAYNQQIKAIEKHRKRVMRELDRQAEKLGSVVEYLAVEQQKGEAGDEDEDELDLKLAALMEMVA